MTEFDYDVRARANLARQSRYRKIGSKSKKCPLPTDHMTLKQWKERNGPVMSVSMNKPMNWEVFKALSKELQKEYIEHLIDSHGANGRCIAEMLGVTPSYFSRFISKSSLGITFSRYAKPNAEQKAAWANFMGGVAEVEGAIIEASEARERDEEQPERVEERPEVSENTYDEIQKCCSGNCCGHTDESDTKPESMTMSCFSIVFNGKLDVNMIANSLKHILGPDAEGRIEILWRVE